ncbi:MAG: hypothetical protein M3N33_02585, partial [Actinomycetota bacterium]|nr:hypothetical protein [Actinomycetota bacterium]
MEEYNTDMGSTTLETLKRIVGTGSSATYALKVTARKRFREMGYRNYGQMAEVFVEMYVASFRTRHPEGWFFKTHKWWLEHHGLGRKTVDHARKYLRDLGIVEERHWIGNRVEYRLIPATIVEVLFPEGLNSSRPSDKNDPIHDSGTSDGDVLELPVGTDRIVPHVPSRSSHRGDLIEEKAKEVEEKRKSVGGATAVSPPDQTPSSSDQE